MEKTRIFSKSEEVFNLIFPIFFIFASLAEIIIFKGKVDGPTQEIWMYLALFPFLNYLHVFFTPFFLILLPEGRKWFVEKCTVNKSHWMILVIFLIAGFRFFFFKAENFSPVAVFIFFAVLNSFGSYHVASQAFGISLLYNKIAVNKHPESAGRINKIEKYERIIFYFQLVILTFAMVTKKTPIERYVTEIVFPISLIGVGVYLFLVYKQTKKLISYKFIYCLRFLLYTLTIKSFFAVIGFISFHGIEYLFITKKIVTADNKNHKFGTSVFIFIFLIIIVAGGFARSLTRGFFLGLWTNAPLDQMILIHSFFSIFIFVHYWIDGLLFRSSDANSRKYILGPLLKEPK